MKKVIQIDLIKYFESIKSWLLLMLIFSIYYLDFVPNPNEENYLQLAKAFIEPNWMKDSFILTESSGTRVLYQYITGFFLKYFSFEEVVFIFRAFFIITYSLVLSKIYKSLKISNIMIVVHLVLLYLEQQSLFAGSWIFITAEAKAFAYLFVLLSLYYILKKRYSLTVLCLIIATYFHILIGFYAFAYLALSILIIERWDFKTNYSLILKLSVYLLIVTPFILVLYNNIEVDKSLKPSSDWIYTYFRNPHHTTLINDEYRNHHFKGILLSFIALISLIYLRKKDTDERKNEVLYITGIVTFACTLLLVSLIFIDKTGTFLKFYLFRINAFSTFIFTLVLTKWIFKIAQKKYDTIIYAAIAIMATLQLINVALDQYREIKSYKDVSFNEACEYIKTNTSKSSVILGLFEEVDKGFSLDSEDKLSLTRRAERDRFVVYKFVPADLKKIHEWYNRVKMKEQIAKDINVLKPASENYQINYMLTNQTFDKKFLQLEFSNEQYFLYKVTSIGQ